MLRCKLQLNKVGVRYTSGWNSPAKPAYNKKVAPILRSIQYVQAADDYQNQLGQAPTQAKIAELMNRISEKPYLIGQLQQFQKALGALGLDQNPNRDGRVSKLKFYILAMKLRQLHRAFWDQCEYNDISSHKHKFKMDITDVGLLDPKNFTKEDYDKIMAYKQENL